MIWQFWCLVRNGALPTAFPHSPDSFMTEPSCRDRLELALTRIADPNGEGARTCLTVYEKEARAAADAADARAARGTSLGPLDGVIVTVKDLFDVAGEVTRAGSKILAEERQAGNRRCAGGAAAARRGRGDRRQDQHDRVRLFRHRRQSAFRHAGQSARSDARARRLVVGSRRRGRRRHMRHRHRHRHRRLGARSGGVCAASSASSRAGNVSRPPARFP